MNVIQLFNIGEDNKLYTRWRTPGGTWTEVNPLFGTPNPLFGTPKGRVATATVPGTDILQLFYRATDNSIHSRWRNPDGRWSGEQYLGGILNGDPIAAQIPGTNILQLFYRGTDNSIYTQWRNPDGSWSGEFQIGGNLKSDPVAAEVIAPTPASYTVVLMFWGPPQAPYQEKWLSTVTEKDLSQALIKIAGSTYFNRLAQYNIKQVTIAPDPPELWEPQWTPESSQFITVFTFGPSEISENIPDVIEKSFWQGIPSPDTFSNTIPIYVVITPYGSLATDTTPKGKHSSAVWGPDNLIYIYAYVIAQQDLNDTLAIATHEIVEAIGKNGGSPKELCDGCQGKWGRGVSPGIDSYTVASYFDAETNQCVAPPGFAKRA